MEGRSQDFSPFWDFISGLNCSGGHLGSHEEVQGKVIKYGQHISRYSHRTVSTARLMEMLPLFFFFSFFKIYIKFHVCLVWSVFGLFFSFWGFFVCGFFFLSFILMRTQSLKLRGKKKSVLWRYWRVFFCDSDQQRKLTAAFLSVSASVLASCHMLHPVWLTACALSLPCCSSLPLSAPACPQMPDTGRVDRWQFPWETQIRECPVL